jgi:type VI secretion system secreted protein VgrG
MKDLFTVSSSALPEGTQVAGFQGTEGVSRLYQFDLYLVVGAEGQSLDLADAMGAKATLTVDRDDGRQPFVVHGVLAAFELLHELDERSLFRATLVPQLWHLTRTLHSRVFTQQSIPEIIKAVLEDGGLGRHDYVFELAESYPPQEHVCQYRESNLDFISRWMEREGMYYYFEQGDSGERLVITDSRAFQTQLDDRPVRFSGSLSGGSHDASAGEALHTFTCKHQALPATLRLKDYDYQKPTLDVAGSATVSTIGLGEISAYGGRFFSPDEGQRLAELRAQELQAQQVVYRGAGTALYLRAGYVFKLDDHPRPAFDMKYLVTSAEHRGNQSLASPELRALAGFEGGPQGDRVYWVEVTAIPAKVQLRAESRTAWPRIYGMESATVCGPTESEYAQIDESGRYHVKLKFDESDLKDGRASTWVRMLQPHGGGIEGFHFPLRKGTEIIVTFLGGDPDRPVIAGVVNNALTPSPVTRVNHTTNVIQTGGRNRLELEDKAGHQRITLQTPYANTRLRMGAPNDDHNLILRTDGASLLDVGTVYDVNVGGTKTEVVLGARVETTVGAVTEVTVGAAAELFVGVQAEVNLGPKVEAVLGPHLENNTLKIEVTGVEVTETGIQIEDVGMKFDAHELLSQEHDLHLHDAGFTIFL